MQTCDDGHRQVAFEDDGELCPVCEMLMVIDGLENDLEQVQDNLDRAQERLDDQETDG